MMRKPTGIRTLLWRGVVCLALILFTFAAKAEVQSGQTSGVSHEPCKIQSTTYKGFVNPQFKGKHLPPLNPGDKPTWYNYGGDKIWPMPEGTQDDQHWPGPISDALDDGEYAFRILSQDSRCSVRLEGPPEPKAGLQYTRDIAIDSNSPEISFHAVMKNISARNIRWSVQSVTQYDTGDPENPKDFNRDFWAFTPVHPQSAYLDGFHIRSGLADDPSFAVKNRLLRYTGYTCKTKFGLTLPLAGLLFSMHTPVLPWWSVSLYKKTQSTPAKPQLFFTKTARP
jgi:hypothetical protein